MEVQRTWTSGPIKSTSQITLISTDFTERIDRNFTHFEGELTFLSNLFQISVISEISGYHLPF